MLSRHREGSSVTIRYSDSHCHRVGRLVVVVVVVGRVVVVVVVPVVVVVVVVLLFNPLARDGEEETKPSSCKSISADVALVALVGPKTDSIMSDEGFGLMRPVVGEGELVVVVVVVVASVVVVVHRISDKEGGMSE